MGLPPIDMPKFGAQKGKLCNNPKGQSVLPRCPHSQTFFTCSRRSFQKEGPRVAELGISVQMIPSRRCLTLSARFAHGTELTRIKVSQDRWKTWEGWPGFLPPSNSSSTIYPLAIIKEIVHFKENDRYRKTGNDRTFRVCQPHVFHR